MIMEENESSDYQKIYLDLNSDILSMIQSPSPSSSCSSFEKLKMEKLLPPCQVCNGKSSGYHYGANTCEACKVFFRRNSSKASTLHCQNGQNNCRPTTDFYFPCKSCRFQKCLEAKMSKNAIKIGRYTKERREKNLKTISNLTINDTVIPPLFKFTDCDDILTASAVEFSNLWNIEWENEIEGFDDLFKKSKIATKNGFYPNNEFMDVLELTGVTIDERQDLNNFYYTVFEIMLKKAITFFRKLPGFADLNKQDFMEVILDRAHNINLAITCSSQDKISIDDDGISYKLNDEYENRCTHDEYMKLGDKYISDTTFRLIKRLKKVNLSPEEIPLIVTLSMLQNSEKSGSKYEKIFQNTHLRIVNALTRYLKAVYGVSYHKRLIELANFMCFHEEVSNNILKWALNHQAYIEWTCKDRNTISAFIFRGKKNENDNCLFFEKMNIND